ncbi:MAG: hypothetical protein AUK64_2307 [bacterium P201]|nr:MAG: hypothetical protein AUK64_2307 [bacterium P201]
MGKIVYMAPVEAMSGKFAKQSYKVNNTRDKNSFFIGNYWTRTSWKYFGLKNVPSPRNEDPSEQQAARRQKFAATIAAIKQKKANPTEWEAIKEGFKNQTRYKLLWNYAFAVIYPTIS